MGNEGRLKEEIAELKARIEQLESGIQADQVVRSIAANSPSTIVLLDREARVRYSNRSIPAATEGGLGTCLYDLVGEADSVKVRAAFQRVEKTHKPDRYETSYFTPSGEQSWWESSVGPVLRDSQLAGFAVVSTNVTEQRLKVAELERFFALSADMMCVATFDGRFERLNPAFKKALQYDNDLLNKSFADFVHPDDVGDSWEAVKRIIDGENIVEFVNRYRAKNGEYRWFSWWGTADKQRKVIYAVARDITENREREAQFRQSQKMKAIGQLAGGIAHDFNNLLLAIQGNIQLALRDPSLAGELLQDALAASRQAAALTQQLLLFSRDKSLSPTSLDLNGVLSSVMCLLKRLLPENIRIEVQHASRVPAVMADKVQLEQVVANLCLNARDAMPNGGGLSLAIATKRVDEKKAGEVSVRPGQFVVLTVSDTGCGMTPDIQTHIFEPFFSTKGVGKGTGLGLATVYGIVQRHQGFLEVESTAGRGTSFRVYLPETSQAPDNFVSRPSPLPAAGEQETILLAEDEPFVRRIIERTLSREGYRVLVAKDGLEAVELYRKHGGGIDLALLDVNMPNLGGIEAAKQMLRCDEALRVIFASGYVDEPKTQADLKGTTTLDKPYEREELLRLVRDKLTISKKSSVTETTGH